MGISAMEWFIIIFIVLLSIADIGLNIIAGIPLIGAVFESASETVLELIQIFLVIILAVISR